MNDTKDKSNNSGQAAKICSTGYTCLAFNNQLQMQITCTSTKQGYFAGKGLESIGVCFEVMLHSLFQNVPAAILPHTGH